MQSSKPARLASVPRFVAALIVASLLAASGQARADDKVVRIGYQKYGKLVLLKGRGTLEGVLKPLGFAVEWREFPSGPPLLEALNAGAIDFGLAGEAPPIFAQAAGVPLVYLAYEPPAPRGEAILVAKDSPLKTIADLRGKKVALNKGSNVHYLLARALERAGVKYSEIQPQFLAPADARAAFERGAVDAWVIWDPYLAAAEAATGGRQLADGTGLVANTQFYFGSRSFVASAENAPVLDAILTQLREVDDWTKRDPGAVARQLSAAVGIPAPILEVAIRRQGLGIKPIDAATIAEQQKIADTFSALGLLPRPIKVSDATKAGS